MNYLNLTITTLTSEDFLGSTPTQRGTWLCLMRYCAQQENGGIIGDADEWGDRKWMQICGVTKDEVNESCKLWEWRGGDIHINHYPANQEARAQAMREAGKKYGRGSNSGATRGANGIAKGKGKGKGKDKGKTISDADDLEKNYSAKSFKKWTLDDFKQSIRDANRDGDEKYSILSSDECKEFFDYWVEPDGNNTPKFKKQQTWETKRRMRTSAKLIHKRDKSQKPTQKQEVIL